MPGPVLYFLSAFYVIQLFRLNHYICLEFLRMKALFFTLFLSVCSIVTQAQIVVLLNEDFNSGFPSGWQVIDNEGLVPHADVNDITSGFGYLEDSDSTGISDSIVACTSWFTPAGTADNYLITPQLSLENHGNILYWDVKSQDPSYPDGYEILVSTSLPVIDSFKVDSAIFYTDAEFPYWTARSISLDNYISQNIYIAFHHFSTDKFVLKFDNIRVFADTTLSVSEAEDNLSFGVYPNPANESVFISVKNNRNADLITFYNTNGEIVLADKNSKQLSVASLPDGIYFLEVIAGNSRGVKRIVVQR